MNKNFSIPALWSALTDRLGRLFGRGELDDHEKSMQLFEKWQRIMDECRTLRTRSTEEIFEAENAPPKTRIVSVDEFAAPDRRRALVSVESGGGVKNTELIRIGALAFIREDGGEWRRPTSEAEVSTGSLGSSTGRKLIERTIFDGQEVEVYEHLISAGTPGEDERRTTRRYWFNKLGAVLKIESEEKKIKTGELSRIVSIYEYDPENIEIEAPHKA